MRSALLTLTALAAGAIAAMLVPVAVANAESAVVTIGQLEAQGFDVRLDRIGSAPLDQCEVTSVRNPQERTQLVEVDGRRGRDVLVPIVIARTITVSLNCTR
ncbi:MAG: hypothetical protein JST91_01715 [Actinobacteria bacterium]|nr:hypothetical protein [Actinomycetota bacterium]